MSCRLRTNCKKIIQACRWLTGGKVGVATLDIAFSEYTTKAFVKKLHSDSCSFKR